MLDNFVPILILFSLAVVLALALTGISFLFGPKSKQSQEKLSPYEGGVPLIEPSPKRVPVKFLQVAMLFLIFDIETIGFYPWAVLLHQLKVFGFVEALIFLGVLAVGYIYLWRKGAFKWE